MSKMERPFVLVTGRRRPHEILFLVFSLLIGIFYTFGAPPPTSIAALMPAWQVKIWAIGLLISGVTGLFSTLLNPSSERAMLLEMGAMLIGAGAFFISGGAAAQFGLRAAFSVGWAAALMAANLWRSWQIRQDLRAMRKMS